eukprot:m.75643 g.75643  ORF g.75643 m.75643 type:complete len:511 (-) comp9007_c0_seq2:85-1617(-)
MKMQDRAIKNTPLQHVALLFMLVLSLADLGHAVQMATPWVQDVATATEFALTTNGDWHTVRAQCIEQGGDLASIDSSTQNAFVVGLFSSGSPWIGLSDWQDEGTHVWSDGLWSDGSSPSPFYTNWHFSAPNDYHPTYGGEDCVVIMPDGYWNDAPCTFNFPGICRRWKRHGASTEYRLILHTAPQPDMEAVCVAFGGHLASITSVSEHNFVTSLLSDAGVGSSGFWTGLTDVAREGTFTWSDGSPFTFSSWGNGEPNNVGNEDCMETSRSGNWNDLPCHAPRRAICERPRATQAPTQAPTESPTPSPTESPTLSPTQAPTISPTGSPSLSPTQSPTLSPTQSPSLSPTQAPSLSPTQSPTVRPTTSPTQSPTLTPTLSPTNSPTTSPTVSPTTRKEGKKAKAKDGKKTTKSNDMGKASQAKDGKKSKAWQRSSSRPPRSTAMIGSSHSSDSMVPVVVVVAVGVVVVAVAVSLGHRRRVTSNSAESDTTIIAETLSSESLTLAWDDFDPSN